MAVAGDFVDHASSFLTTSPCTSVRRKSRPWKRCVSRKWSMVVGHLVSERRHRIAIDNGDRASERALLHLVNLCMETRRDILVAARHPPASWTVSLSDLDSRLRAVLAIGVGLPDDALLGAVLVKHFADRQLRVAPEVIAYLLTHMERSFAAAPFSSRWMRTRRTSTRWSRAMPTAAETKLWKASPAIWVK